MGVPKLETIDALLEQELSEPTQDGHQPLIDDGATFGLVPPGVQQSQLDAMEKTDLAWLEEGRPASKLSLVLASVGVVVILGLVAMVYDTRREVTALSDHLRTHPVAPEPPQIVRAAPRTVTLTFGPLRSVEYRAPVHGVVTRIAEPGTILEPGDLVAETMNARDYRRLVKARARYRWFRNRARRSEAHARRARRAKWQALRYLKRGRMTYVRAGQRGVARPVAPMHEAASKGAVLVQLDDPTTLVAAVPDVKGLDVDWTCRFEGEAEAAACALRFERDDAGRPTAEVLLDNAGARHVPGASVTVVLEPPQRS